MPKNEWRAGEYYRRHAVATTVAVRRGELQEMRLGRRPDDMPAAEGVAGKPRGVRMKRGAGRGEGHD